MTVAIKIHRIDQGGIIEILVALADMELVGKTLKDDFFVSSRFYHGKELEVDKIDSLLKNATIINAVGDKSVKKIISLGLADKDCVINIGNVPHAQVIVMGD